MPTEKILKTLLRNGGQYADIFSESTQATTIICDDKKIETASSGIDTGIALRVIADLKTFFGFSNHQDPKSVLNLAKNLSQQIRSKRFDEIVEESKTPPPQFIKKNPGEVNMEEKIKIVQKANDLAWAGDPRVVQVRVRYHEVTRNIEIANSVGSSIKYPTTLVQLSLLVTTSNGKTYHRGYHSMGGHLGMELFEEQSLEDMVNKAVCRALINLTACPARGGTMPVVISAKAGGTIVHEAVGHGLEADLACEGQSVFENQLGQLVANPLINVVDDPTLPNRRGSFLYDDEGTPAERVTLIENGILKDYLFDRLTALKMNRRPNAHGRRESYRYKPIVRMANTLILPGKEDPEKILRSVDRGLFVKMMGGGQVNTVNGDFMFEVTEGYRIENGKIGEPVTGATLTGNGPAILKMIDRVGSDLGFSIGTCGKDGQEAPVADAMPTVRIPEMVVGGVV